LKVADLFILKTNTVNIRYQTLHFKGMNEFMGQISKLVRGRFHQHAYEQLLDPQIPKAQNDR